ncbi:MAG: phosphohistidine phosphatase SixA [Bacteroidales bacterium]|nr:phosphohistidine phosphatase SixA [Bacteroidales bacterium]
MKQLIIIRHGKAEEYDFINSDFERSLTKKGKQISRDIAEKLGKKGIRFDAIYSSPAFRAIETAIIFADELGFPFSEIKLKKEIYSGFCSESLQEILQTVENEHNAIAIVGHNPGLTDIASELTGYSDIYMPKTSVVVIESVAENWTDFFQQKRKLLLFEKNKK